MPTTIRRIVTGHDENGRSTFNFDGDAANVLGLPFPLNEFGQVGANFYSPH